MVSTRHFTRGHLVDWSPMCDACYLISTIAYGEEVEN